MMDGYNSITSDIRVNINTADETTLMSLPGIGKAKAKSIVEYRNKNGSFKTTEDLMKIPGIKEGLFAKIEDLVTVK
jgi:competence protein ComEA